MKKTPGEKMLQEKTEPTRLPDGERKISGRQPQKKKGREAPKPFNNPFADALKKR
jgi:hypothetical protein